MNFSQRKQMRINKNAADANMRLLKKERWLKKLANRKRLDDKFGIFADWKCIALIFLLLVLMSVRVVIKF